jgi:hypothetical protein
MIMSVNLAQIHGNLKSGAIWNRSEILCLQGFPLQIQISTQSGRQSRNLAKTFCFQHFSADPRFTGNSPHYMWAKPQGFFAAHVDVRSPAPTTSTPTGENL